MKVEMSLSEVQFSVDRPEQSLGFVFWKTTLQWQRKITEGLKPLDMTHVQFVLMAGIGWLENENDEVTQTMLASHAEVDVMMTSKVLRALESKSWVQRNLHSTDTRAKSLSLTRQGKHQLKKALIIVEDIDKQFFSAIKKNKSQFLENLLNLMKINLKTE